MLADTITPMLITFNEAANLGRVLPKLAWARRILVIDSGSTDETLSMIAAYPQAEVINRPFDSFAEQCNFGLSHIRSDWVLSLDADYELSDELVAELHALPDDPAVSGYRARFIYRVYGRPLRSTLYPPRAVLYRPGKAAYRDEGHGHRVGIDGTVRHLDGAIYHDDRKSLERWFSSQKKYAALEAEHLLNAAEAKLSRVDRIRRKGWPAPLLVFVYVLFVKRALFDGWPGWFYALQRLLAEVMIALEIVERRLR